MALVIVRRPKSPLSPTAHQANGFDNPKIPPVHHKYYAHPSYGAAAPPASALPIPKFFQRSSGSAVDGRVVSSSRDAESDRPSIVKVPPNIGKLSSDVSHEHSDHSNGTAQKPILGTSASIEPSALDKTLQVTSKEIENTEALKSLRELQDRTLQKVNTELKEIEQQAHSRRNQQDKTLQKTDLKMRERQKAESQRMPNPTPADLSTMYWPLRPPQPGLLPPFGGFGAEIVSIPRAFPQQPVLEDVSALYTQWIQNQAQIHSLQLQLQTNLMIQKLHQCAQQ